jgi:hypothetical protein
LIDTTPDLQLRYDDLKPALEEMGIDPGDVAAIDIECARHEDFRVTSGVDSDTAESYEAATYVQRLRLISLDIAPIE